jgi:DNA-binding NtrC family response regulator
MEREMANILILEDQPSIQESFQGEMLKQGHNLATLYNAGLAKVYLKHTRPDLVLLDPCLNGFEGWDLLCDIQKSYPNLPVLIVTDFAKSKTG